MKRTITMNFSVELALCTEISDARAKKLTVEYQDPNEKWADEADSCVECWLECLAEKEGLDAIEKAVETHFKKLELDDVVFDQEEFGVSVDVSVEEA